MTTLSDFVSEITGGNDVTVNILVGATSAGVPTICKVSSDGTLLMSEAANGGESSISAGSGSKTVTHGVGAIPSIINITPEDGFDSPWEIVRASTSATVFVVRYKGGVTQAPGTTGYFLWEAKK
jgi:hypothetical protein